MPESLSKYFYSGTLDNFAHGYSCTGNPTSLRSLCGTENEAIGPNDADGLMHAMKETRNTTLTRIVHKDVGANTVVTRG